MALDQMQVNRLWEAVERTSRELVWELDPNGVLRFVNHASAEVLGFPPHELVGRNVFSLIHPDDLDMALDVFAGCLRNRTGWDRIRLRVVKPSGLTPWVETSGLVHCDPDGRVVQFTATTRLLDADDARQVELGFIRRRITDVLFDRSLATVWQPIFSLANGRVVGAEALTRFGDRSIPPDRWFADAVEVGLGVELEVAALEKALAAAAAIPERVYLSLNASPALVASGNLLGLLERFPVGTERVVLELTEHVSVEDYEGLVVPLRKLRTQGVRLAVDDAGAGFASFRHILRLDPDIIKLDQSIVRGITDNPAQRALATAVVLFALEVGRMTVVAEGVETASDLATISTLGLDAAQGYHLARPTAVADVDWAAATDGAWEFGVSR